jgi:hypothetical protein
MGVRKFRNVPVEIDGIRFASKAEGRRYSELKLLERAGEIRHLELQRRYVLTAFDGTKIATYVADFDYTERRTGQHVTEDVKGIATPTFKLKAKLFEIQFGRKISIVRA